jgi:hypothetical protein
MDSVQQEVQHSLISLGNYEIWITSDAFNHVLPDIREVLELEVVFVRAGLSGPTAETGLKTAEEFFKDCRWAYEHGDLKRSASNVA